MFARRRGLFDPDGEDLINQVKQEARPLTDAADLDPLLDQIGDARYVLLGEASHGTSEYYTWRARLSQRLIQEKGFSFIAVEGDWPACYEVNRYVKGYPDATQEAVLQGFERWPTWMWANWEIVALTGWLKRHNETAQRQAGFYGLDVYSLWESMRSIIDYLERTDPEAVEVAKRAYMCFEPFGEDEQLYAQSTAFVSQTCEDEVIELLSEIYQHARKYDTDPEAAFNAEQNARVAVEAERYYRTMIRGGPDSWNVRDRHMMDTLNRLMAHHGDGAKAIVWAHNTHIGDARATDMAGAGMFNIGQLVREQHQAQGVHLVGFGSQRGSVIAGSAWGAPMEKMPVPRARDGSWEDILHRAGPENKLLLLTGQRQNEVFLAGRGHRAIGVVYHPNREQFGNYVPTVLPERYDAFLFIDETEALHPLYLQPVAGEPPELYPWGL